MSETIKTVLLRPWFRFTAWLYRRSEAESLEQIIKDIAPTDANQYLSEDDLSALARSAVAVGGSEPCETGEQRSERAWRMANYIKQCKWDVLMANRGVA